MTYATPTPSLLDVADRDVLRERFGTAVRFDEPLAPLVWWKAGGPADALVVLRNEDDAEALFRHAFRRGLPVFALGNGSNVLVGDGGIRGIVVRAEGDFEALDVREEGGGIVVRAGGGASLPLLVTRAASLGALGVDGLAGVPATVGGAVRMNAGTDTEIGTFVRELVVQQPSRPEPHAVHVRFDYRHSTLEPAALVARTVLRFERGDPATVREKTQVRLVRRKATQPVAIPNCGSCFRNPEGDKAGRLIESIGAKGWREGAAEVSTLHANFIVNHGGATAREIATLLTRVREAVLERTGVALQPEVHLVGEFLG